MERATIWDRFRQDGFPGIGEMQPTEAGEAFYLAILAFHAKRFAAANAFAECARALDPSDVLHSQAATYLASVLRKGKKNVYVSAAGFATFIRGGGNIPLYQILSHALKEIYQSYAAPTLLDIGAGDGLALLPALTGNIRHVDVVEPSAVLVGPVRDALLRTGLSHEIFVAPLQEFVRSPPPRSWDLIQATFSLQTIPPAERAGLLEWTARTGARLVLAEFDAPECTNPCSPEWVEQVTARYRQGLAEYPDHQDLVGQDFLMPVLFGYFDASKARTNFEHPATEWIAQLRAAGYRTVDCRVLYPYWWAPAILLDAAC